MLSQRFQQAIDRAAMRAGKGGSGPYLAEWRRETSRVEIDGDPAEVARAEASRLEEAFSDEQLEALIRNHAKAAEP